MDMQLDGERIRTVREARAWSQEHLAEAAGLSLRTVQRIERSGAASYETARALAAVFEMEVAALATRPSQPRRRRIRYWAMAASILVGVSAMFVAQEVRAGDVQLNVNLSLNDQLLSKSQMIAADGKSAEIRLEGQVRVVIAPVVQQDGSVLLSISVDEFSSKWVRVAEPKLQAFDNDEAVVSMTSPTGNVFRIAIRPHRI